MQLTKSKLKQIIKEEMIKLQEGAESPNLIKTRKQFQLFYKRLKEDGCPTTHVDPRPECTTNFNTMMAMAQVLHAALTVQRAEIGQELKHMERILQRQPN